MITLKPRYESHLTSDQTPRSLAETALGEMTTGYGKLLQKYEPVDPEKPIFQVIDSSGTELTIQFWTEEDFLRRRRRNRLNKALVSVVMTGREKVDELKRMILEAIRNACHFMKRSIRNELRRQKARFDSRFVRPDRGCFAH